MRNRFPQRVSGLPHRSENGLASVAPPIGSFAMGGNVTNSGVIDRERPPTVHRSG
jgi:hypothetical protein